MSAVLARNLIMPHFTKLFVSGSSLENSKKVETKRFSAVLSFDFNCFPFSARNVKVSRSFQNAPIMGLICCTRNLLIEVIASSCAFPAANFPQNISADLNLL